MKYRTDLILSEAFWTFIFFYFLDAGLSVLNGLQFYFWLRDREKSQLSQFFTKNSRAKLISSYFHAASISYLNEKELLVVD